ncbi:GGDEF domain-containing protein [Aminobacter sp. AP02]|uniref:GGDEF domain-containing protein n=1 Tax=Aminobacter sp. AP02 TaxID=2135737 RepID=UPI000D6C42B8|nr:GGDEF domain-containing protein [Aminobacter sp. AP02]PWK63842.1 diguanylate cyclase (GGDEF)-like protein [Aminobacter sp. AP02]
MKLDFPTLYIVILLNSLTLTVIWGAIAHVHRNIAAARHWLGACILTTVGGGLLAMQGDGFSLALAISGNALVIFGFGLVWIGVRSFYGRSGGWWTSALVTLVGVAVLTIVRDSSEARNVVYASGQIVLVSLASFHLLFREERSLGAWVAALAMIVGILGQGAEAVMNLMRIAGVLSDVAYYDFAAFCLLTIIFGAVVWNFGFVLLAIDRLRSELAALAVADELTGLPNRRRFVEIATAEALRAVRSEKPYSVLMIDLDDFKAINDICGHAAGDAALRHFAGSAGALLPAQATLARLGGDEFCVLLPETAAREAAAVADQLVRGFHSADFDWKGEKVALTASIGVAEWLPAYGADPATVIEKADAALYETKRSGRNGYSIFCSKAVKVASNSNQAAGSLASGTETRRLICQ